ncbi:Transcriptional regulator, AsnC family [Microbacterium esteraromaticum]|uniref:Transcriptional regulator, AsnC family n=1 Tax=Microbacterium esteraromaticum TaxID=57043 RepID=A0A1R4I8H6_9MICO|nr:Lrp/AsnC family transcriptional regulator [Microbacterium esteraromaticum]SJN16078.1 Transcriptional regulator, AsnC family [Microbacterium esteraromaticum]
MARNRMADRTDRTLLRELIRDPAATIVALASATGLARNTVRARLTRYDEDGTLRSFQNRVDPAVLGYPLRAYVVTSVTQRKLGRVGESLAEIPEVVEVLGLTGITDLLIRVVAKDADDLYRIAGRILDVDGVKRTTTGLVMREMVPYRVEQLL